MLWKFIDRPREDSLTASVFSHLLHLPSEVFWDILRHACPSAHFPEYPGEPLRIHAWPNWNAAGTRNTDRIIPDLVIEFAAFDLLVEAKRWDVPMQDQEQWMSELIAYTNEYGHNNREVRMIALGGIHSHQDVPLTHEWRSAVPGGRPGTSDTHIFDCPVYMCQWSSLLLECQRRKRQLERVPEPSSRARSDLRILNDLISLFARHGFAALRWFSDYNFKANFIDASSEADQQIFRNATNKLDHG